MTDPTAAVAPDPEDPEDPDAPDTPDEPADPSAPHPRASPEPATAGPAGRDTDRAPRPMIERIGLAAIALVLATLFGGMAAASWVGGELFLAVMGAVGCAMTVWVGVLTLVRG